MTTSSQDIKVDGFRFINNVHTTARQLATCSQIVSLLGSSQMPRKLIRELLTKWSLEQELKNNDYKNIKGKITDNGKETSTLRYYLELTGSLGLTSHFNNFFSNTNISYVFLHFLKEKNPDSSFNLDISEKVFYLFQLFYIDADGILLTLTTLKEAEKKSQSELQKKCKEVLNRRLLAKQEMAPPITKITISEKYRIINFVWKKPEKYAEHIISPRLEWLSSLGLVNILRSGTITSYSFTDIGLLFFEAVPVLSIDSSVKDINDGWIFNDLFVHIEQLYFSELKSVFPQNEPSNKKDLVKKSLQKAIAVVKSSSSFRFPLLDTLLFICMDNILSKKAFLKFSDVISEFSDGLIIEGKQYFLKEAARINESYITTRVIE
jgi:hypothetical protein